MDKDFDQILDECIDRVNRGDSFHKCLEDYPEYAADLRPLLEAMLQTKAAYSFHPSDEAKRAGRLRLYSALDKRHRPSIWQRIFAQRLVWATVATVLVIAIVGYLGLKPVIAPVIIPTETISASNPEGNFVFLVSDEVNAIADFSELMVTIDKVSLLKNGADEKWMEFNPGVKTFDLTLLPGEVTQELWRGDLPEGNYSKVVINVSRVTGTLKATKEILEIKLPGNKLQLSSSFKISAENITSFTYDITVVHAGKAQGGQKYLLKPQASESGATNTPNPATDNNQDKSKGKKTTETTDTSLLPSVTNNRKK